MRYMLDTNTCIFLIRKKPAGVIMRLTRTPVDDVMISAITLSELEYGVHKSEKREQNLLALTEFIAPLEVVPFDDSAASHYGRIRAHLEAKGTPIGPMDLLIASHALSLDLTVVTNNTKEFRRVPKLKVEDWTR